MDKFLTVDKQSAVSLGDIARVTEGQLSGDPNTMIADVTHDSRQAGQGSLFVAVRGELFDAHKFVPQVMQQGAAGVISDLERPADFSGAWIQV